MLEILNSVPTLLADGFVHIDLPTQVVDILNLSLVQQTLITASLPSFPPILQLHS